jgi:hypothetical protein
MPPTPTQLPPSLQAVQTVQPGQIVANNLGNAGSQRTHIIKDPDWYRSLDVR